MTIRKKTIDKSVKHITQGEQTQERDKKRNIIKKRLRKQKKTAGRFLETYCKKISRKFKNYYMLDNKILFLNLEHTDTSIEETKTKPLQKFEFEVNKRIESFSYSPSINPVEERIWMKAVTSFETTNSFSSITDENNSFQITIPDYWTSAGGPETYFKLRYL